MAIISDIGPVSQYNYSRGDRAEIETEFGSLGPDLNEAMREILPSFGFATRHRVRSFAQLATFVARIDCGSSGSVLRSAVKARSDFTRRCRALEDRRAV